MRTFFLDVAIFSLLVRLNRVRGKRLMGNSDSFNGNIVNNPRIEFCAKVRKNVVTDKFRFDKIRFILGHA